MLFGVFTLDNAAAQQAPAVSREDGIQDEPAENNGTDFTRPENLFQLRYAYRTSPGSGGVGDMIRTVTSEFVILRADLKVDLAPQWTLAFRGDLPYVVKNPITSDNPGGNYVYGIGDADVQAALIKTIDARWAAGAGLRLIAP